MNIDPVSAAGAFATIVGLICNFRQERGAAATLDHQQFMEWLEYHRHGEIKNLITNTATLQGEVDKLLRADHGLILEKLDAINHALASLLSQVTEFRGLAHALVPTAEVSGQAISILRQLVESSSSYFIRIKYEGGCSVQFELERDGLVALTEPRFLDDDLDQLVGLGLLGKDYGSTGVEIYRVTRNSVRLVSAVQ
jgi:hypothetical protein